MLYDESPEVIYASGPDEDACPILHAEDVPGMPQDSKDIWQNIVPDKIKVRARAVLRGANTTVSAAGSRARWQRCACLLVSHNLLSWSDILEDGNLVYEIGFTERSIWPEPERWHQTVCNFLKLMAWEKTVEGTARLFPTARLQIVRELYFGEWQVRDAAEIAELPPRHSRD